MMGSELARDLAAVLNRHSVESESGTPDLVLAEYLVNCLRVWAESTKARDRWWEFRPEIGGNVPAYDWGDQP